MLNHVHPIFLSIIVSTQCVYLESSSLHTVISLQHSQLMSTFSSRHHVTIVFTIRVTFPLQSLRNISCKANIKLTLIVWLRSWIVGTQLNCNNTVGARRASHSPSIITVSVPTPKHYCERVGVTHGPFKWHIQLPISNLCFTRHFGRFRTSLFSPFQEFCTHFSNQVSWTSFFLFHLLSHDKFLRIFKILGIILSIFDHKFWLSPIYRDKFLAFPKLCNFALSHHPKCTCPKNVSFNLSKTCPIAFQNVLPDLPTVWWGSQLLTSAYIQVQTQLCWSAKWPRLPLRALQAVPSPWADRGKVSQEGIQLPLRWLQVHSDAALLQGTLSRWLLQSVDETLWCYPSTPCSWWM